MRNLNKFRSLFLATSLALSTFAFTSCDDDNDGPSGAYAEEGVFVVNEGSFQQSNGSISFYNSNTNQVQQDIFSQENPGRILGDIVQDLEIFGDRAFIVVNNSNKVEVVNANTFEALGTVEGLELPRHLVALNEDKAYVTETVGYNGSNGRVAVIDLNNYTVTNTIEVGVQPEELLLAGGKLYVANSGENTVSVINTATDAVEETITVSDAPRSLELDRNNTLWVLSAGKVAYNADWSVDYENTTAGALSAINTSTQTLQSTFTFGSNESQPGNLTINGSGDKLYFTFDGKTYVQDTNASSLTGNVFLDRSFYGLDVDPETGYVYGADANGFAGAGTVLIYQANGTKVGEFRAGIGPNGFAFN